MVLMGTFLIPSSLLHAFEFSTHGYYRLRFDLSHDLDLQTINNTISQGGGNNDRFGTIAFGQQRFRLDPILKLNDNISFQSQLDILDNTLFGQSQIKQLSVLNPLVGTVQLPGGNGAFGVTGGASGDPSFGGGGNINIRRLWVDLLTPVGKFRIGRQPSHWGLGIIQNDGNGMDANFGDTNDSVSYLTKYDFRHGGTLVGGFIYNFAFENTVDPTLNTLEGGIGSNNSDTTQNVLFFLYQTDDFEVGTFGGVRWRLATKNAPTTMAITNTGQVNGVCNGACEGTLAAAGKDGNTLLYFTDFYGKGTWRNYSLGVEAVYISGKITTGIAIPAIVLTQAEQQTSTNPVTTPIEMEPESHASVFMAAMELDAKYDFGGEVKLLGGYAQGDSSPLTGDINQFGFNKDYDIALMLFNEPMGTSPAVQLSDGRVILGQKPMSGNSINNAAYVALRYKHNFNVSGWLPQAKDFKLGIKGITAWAPANNLDLDFSQITGVPNLPHYLNTSKWYGFEIDVSAEATFFDYMKWVAQAGFFVPGSLYDIKTEDTRNFNTNGIQGVDFDGADPAFEVKTTLFFEF